MAMEVARALSALREQTGAGLGRTIRFVTFGGEEQMLQGSRAYVRDHFGADPLPRLVVNLDELAVGPMKGLILQFPELRAFVQGWLDSMDDQLKCHVLELMDTSGDGFPFARRGIPAALGVAVRGQAPGRRLRPLGLRHRRKSQGPRLKGVRRPVGEIVAPAVSRPAGRLVRTLAPARIEERLEAERGRVMRVM